MTPALMIDIETVDNKPTAAIASIGSVLFDPYSDWLGDSFHMHVNIEDCMRHGLTIGPSTVLWWLEQDDAARHTLVVGQLAAASLRTSLEALRSFFPRGASKEECEIWCNGASFDLPILTNAYNAIGIDPPWTFWAERDLRTLKALNRGIELDRQGTHHNALDDALHQARLVQRILQANPDIDS